MLVSILLLSVGLALIIQGGDWFVSAAVRAAEYLKMPRVVIGSTLVSLATTSPELVVSIMAGLKGESGLAVGNAIGSCLCNVGLILGLTAAIKHIDIQLWELRTALIALFAAGVTLLIMTLDLELSRVQGALLLAAGLGYFCYDFLQHKMRPKPGDFEEATAIEAGLTAHRRWLHTRWGTACQFLLGAAVVVVGSRFLVDGAVGIAVRLSIPPILIGLTVVAVGTSLPELITGITSSRRSVSDLAVGNVIGANIANLTLIVGTAAFIHTVTLDRAIQLYNFPAMLILFALLLYMLWTDRRITRREGIVLVVYYSLFLCGLVLFAAAQSPGPT